jgi:hypothetical protein
MRATVAQAIRLRPDRGSRHFGLGRALLDQKKFADAETALRKAIRLDPVDPWVPQLLGQALTGRRQVPSPFRPGPPGAVSLPPGAAPLAPRAPVAHHRGREGVVPQGREGLVPQPPGGRPRRELHVDYPLVKEASEKSPMAKKVYASFTKFQAQQAGWSRISEGAYHQFVAL